MSGLDKILSSKVRAEIFRLLFGLDSSELHMRALQRKTGMAIGTIQHEIRQLSELELVLPRRDGNRLYYRANKEHPLFHDIHNMVLKTSGLVDVLVHALAVKEIQFAFVFGSVAKQEEKSTSDIDLMVVGSLGLRKLAPLLKEPSEKLGREINAHILTKDEFQKRKNSREHFVTRVLAAPKIFIIGTENELEAMGR